MNSITTKGQFHNPEEPQAFARAAHRTPGIETATKRSTSILVGSLVIALVLPSVVKGSPIADYLSRPALTHPPGEYSWTSLYQLDVDESWLQWPLTPGGVARSPLSGELALTFSAPDAAPAPGFDDAAGGVDPDDVVRVVARYAMLYAWQWDADSPTVPPDPIIFTLDPDHPSVGWWIPRTGEFYLRLWLVTPVAIGLPMPFEMRGTLREGHLSILGCPCPPCPNDPTICPCPVMRIVADEVIPPAEFRFSTEIGFTSGSAGGLDPVSDGDLLSDRQCVVLTNQDLTANLGIMPVVPDLGLDAATLTFYRPVLFSLEESVFSETLGWINHGDLLSIQGRIVRTNFELIDAFDPGPIPLDGVGLDAVHVGVLATATNCGILFSTEIDFWSQSLGQMVGHGDLLNENGTIYRTNAALMRNFRPFDPNNPNDPPEPTDYGLDAVYVTRHGRVWFSVEQGFYDRNLGWVSDGDVLSESGRVIRRNLELLRACAPLEDLANFGLDTLDFKCRYRPTPNDEELEAATPGGG